MGTERLLVPSRQLYGSRYNQLLHQVATRGSKVEDWKKKVFPPSCVRGLFLLTENIVHFFFFFWQGSVNHVLSEKDWKKKYRLPLAVFHSDYILESAVYTCKSHNNRNHWQKQQATVGRRSWGSIKQSNVVLSVLQLLVTFGFKIPPKHWDSVKQDRMRYRDNRYKLFLSWENWNMATLIRLQAWTLL